MKRSTEKIVHILMSEGEAGVLDLALRQLLEANEHDLPSRLSEAQVHVLSDLQVEVQG